jgi:ABC-type Fe3+-siderophore transport system permease subunit
MRSSAQSKKSNPLSALAVAMFVGVASFLAIMIGLAWLGGREAHSLRSLGNWIVAASVSAVLGAFTSFLLLWWRLNR